MDNISLLFLYAFGYWMGKTVVIEEFQGYHKNKFTWLWVGKIGGVVVACYYIYTGIIFRLELTLPVLAVLFFVFL